MEETTVKVTYKEIAEAADIDTVTAENDRRAGAFDKQDLRSVALYIAEKLAPPAHPVNPDAHDSCWQIEAAESALEWED